MSYLFPVARCMFLFFSPPSCFQSEGRCAPSRSGSARSVSVETTPVGDPRVWLLPAHLPVCLALSTQPPPLLQSHSFSPQERCFSPQASPTVGCGGPASNCWVWPGGTMPGCSGGLGRAHWEPGRPEGSQANKPFGPQGAGRGALSEQVSRSPLPG